MSKSNVTESVFITAILGILIIFSVFIFIVGKQSDRQADRINSLQTQINTLQSQAIDSAETFTVNDILKIDTTKRYKFIIE